MPEVAMSYLVAVLLDVGPVMPGGFGPAVVSHGELRAWQENAGITLQPWEIGMVRRLSALYLSESAAAERPDAPAPFKTEAQVLRSNTAKSLKNAVRRMS